MDLARTAAYFDRTLFENYDQSTNSWAGTFFHGQLKLADKFQTIYHRPTRKRMLYCAPGSEPTGSVVRVVETGETFMVGALQTDVHDDQHYRNVYALHRPRGQGTITRRVPVGPSNNPGWAVSQLLGTFWMDFELRSTNEKEDAIPSQRGSYFCTLPYGTDVQPGDLLFFEGKPYYALDDYIDSSLQFLRVAQHADPREDFVYRSRTLPDTYSGGSVTRNFTNYNVTGRVGTSESREADGPVIRKELMLKINEGWIGVTPKMDDEVTLWGSRYTVRRVIRDAEKQEWNLQVGI